jgi:hypothetical protein
MNEISEQSFGDKMQGVKNWSTRSKTSASATFPTQITYGLTWNATRAPQWETSYYPEQPRAPQREILKSGMNSEEFEEGRNNEANYQVKNGEYSYMHMAR